jgi:hypothetical protein
MSIERVGNRNTTAIMNNGATIKHAGPRKGKPTVAVASPEKTNEVVDLTRITYAPFLPPGHTQTIFKEKK